MDHRLKLLLPLLLLSAGLHAQITTDSKDYQIAKQRLYIGGTTDYFTVITKTLSGSSTDLQVPTAKSVWDALAAASFTLNRDTTLKGNGSSGNPLGLNQQGALTGEVLKWNGTRWAPGTDNGITGNQTITLTGDVTGAGATAITTLLANSGVTAGTYTLATITVDSKGRVTSASSGSAGGTGTVTSVALSLPGIFSVSGSPITTNGTLTATLANQSANTVFAGPTTGGAAAPTFRALVSSDLPVILPSGITGFDEAAQDAVFPNVVAGSNITVSYNDGANTLTIAGSAGGGLTSLNGLTAGTQVFSTGTSGTDFNISSTTSTHTFNIPSASASNRGLLTAADWTTFNNSVDGSGASGRVAFWSGSSALSSNSNYVFDNTNTRLGIGTTTPYVRNHTAGGDIGAYYSSGSSHGASLYLGDPNFDNSSFFDKAPGLKALYSGATGVASDLGFFIYAGGTRQQGMALNSLGLAIGVSSASERLHVAGNIRFSGALMPNNNAGTAGQRLTSAGPGAPPTWEPLPASPFYQYSLTVPTTASNAVGFAQVTNTNFSANVEIWYTVNSDNFAQSKRYFLPTAYNGTYNGSTHEWQKCLPISTSGPYSGNDAEIDVQIVNGDAFFRVRRTSGSTPGTAKITLLIGGDVPGTTVSAFSTSYTSQTVANNYQPTSLVQRNGNTGVGTDSPTAQLDLVGTLRLRAFAVANNLLGLSDANGNVTSFSPTAVVAAGNGFVQNGNSFSALARLGTNDAQGLALETSNTIRQTISATGGVTYTMPAAELLTLDYSATSAGATNYGIVVKNQLGSSGQGQFLTTQNQSGSPVFYAINRTLSTIFYNTTGRLTQFKQVGAEFQINMDESLWAFRPDLSVSFPSLAGDPTTPANNTVWLTGGRYKYRTGGATLTLANVEDDLTGAASVQTTTSTPGGNTRTVRYDATSNTIAVVCGAQLAEGRDYVLMSSNNTTNAITLSADSGFVFRQSGTAGTSTTITTAANTVYYVRRAGSTIYVK